jgi:hypothetical protein
MASILILEKNPASRQAIAEALQAQGLEKSCTFAEKPQAASPCLWIGAAGEEAPETVRENDRFIKPVRIGALLDRVHYHLNAGARTGAPVIPIGAYDLDTLSNDLRQRESGVLVRLTEKERHILEFLARRKNKTVERRALLDEVWGYADGVETHTLETHI